MLRSDPLWKNYETLREIYTHAFSDNLDCNLNLYSILLAAIEEALDAGYKQAYEEQAKNGHRD